MRVAGNFCLPTSQRRDVDSFNHVGKIKGPILRRLAARAPYFHNGSAQTLLEALKFYEPRFALTLTPQQESDLVAFLESL